MKKTDTKKEPETLGDILNELPPTAREVAEAATQAPQLPKEGGWLVKSGLPATDSAQAASQGMMGLIERLALDPSIDVVKMQALLDMQERIWQRNAEIAFNRDFAALSQVLPRIVKKGSVAYEDKKTGKMEKAFEFALFEDIDEIVRPLIHSHGFSLSFKTEQRTEPGGGLVVVGILAHSEGHSRETRLPLALDGSGGKNNLQGMGSTVSYGRRYATCVLLNIITVGDDNDGHGAPPEPVDLETASKIDTALRAKCKDMDVERQEKTRSDFLAFMKVSDIRDILTTDLDKARNAIAAIGKTHDKKGL